MERKSGKMVIIFFFKATVLDKTVEKIVYLDSIFLNIVAVPVLPSPPSPKSIVVVYSKESLNPARNTPENSDPEHPGKSLEHPGTPQEQPQNTPEYPGTSPERMESPEHPKIQK